MLTMPMQMHLHTGIKIFLLCIAIDYCCAPGCETSQSV